MANDDGHTCNNRWRLLATSAEIATISYGHVTKEYWSFEADRKTSCERFGELGTEVHVWHCLLLQEATGDYQWPRVKGPNLRKIEYLINHINVPLFTETNNKIYTVSVK